MLRTLSVEDHTLCAVLWKLRVIAADTLDELTIARSTGVGYDDLIIRALFRTAPRQTH
jgi:hypothetical protein